MPPTRQRFRILLMLFFTVVITYLDRVNLTGAIIDLQRDFHLDKDQKANILAAFGFAYALVQIPAGWLVDRIRPRLLFALFCGMWSLVTILQGWASSVMFLISMRMMLGVFEAPTYTICNRIVTTWFPDRERAFAIAFYTAGQFIGPAFLLPQLSKTQAVYGWSSVFFLTGVLGLGWALLWYLLYRDPSQSKGVNEAELNIIREGGGLVDLGSAKSKATKFAWADIGLVLSKKKLWGIYLGQFAINSTLWFFLTWFQDYLVTYRHFDFIKAGNFTTWPYLAAFAGILCSGFFSDFMLKRGVSATIARKLPIIAGLLLSTTIIGANYVSNQHLIMLFMCIAFFGNGLSSIAWAMVSALAPKRLLGLTGGVFNCCGNLAPLAVPKIIGLLINGNNFAPALVFVSSVAFLGAMSYIFLVGKVERVEENAAS